jgi:hypothetical protein
MRDALDRLFQDLTLVTIALAIALGWALFQFASGVSELVSTLFIEFPPSEDLLRSVRLSEPLTWAVEGRILTFGPLLRGAIELAVVLAVAILVRRRYERGEAISPNPPR